MTNQPVQGDGPSWISSGDNRIGFGMTSDDKGGIYAKKTSIPLITKLFVDALARLFSRFSVVSVKDSTFLISKDSLARFIATHSDEIESLSSSNTNIQKLVKIVKGGGDSDAIKAAVSTLWGNEIEEIINHVGEKSWGKAEALLRPPKVENKIESGSVLIAKDDESAIELADVLSRFYQRTLGVTLSLDPKRYIINGTKVNQAHIAEDVLMQAFKETKRDKLPKNEQELKQLGSELIKKIKDDVKLEEHNKYGIQSQINSLLKTLDSKK